MAMPNPGTPNPNPHKADQQVPTEPAYDFFAITPSDANDLAMRPRALYIGGDGTLIIHNNNGTAVTLTNVKGGSILSISPRRVVATGTTATGIVGLV